MYQRTQLSKILHKVCLFYKGLRTKSDNLFYKDLRTKSDNLFYKGLRTKSDNLSTQHSANGFYNRDAVCLLRGMDFTFIDHAN